MNHIRWACSLWRSARPSGRPLWWSLALAIIAFASACNQDAESLPELKSWPISIVYWPQTDEFIVGTFGERGIVEVTPSGLDSSEMRIARPDDRRRGIRLAIDPERELLWVLQFNTAHVYRLPERSPRELKLIAVFPTYSRPGIAMCLPDIALQSTGRVLITENAAPVILEIEFEASPHLRQEVRHHPLVPTVGGSGPFGLSALLTVPDTNWILAADARGGRLWRIDRRSWQISEIPIPGGVEGACGLAWERPPKKGEALRVYVSRGFKGGVMLAEVNSDLTSARLLGQAYSDREIFEMATRGSDVYFPLRHRRSAEQLVGDEKIEKRAVRIELGAVRARQPDQ